MYATIKNAQLLSVNHEIRTFKDSTYEVRTADILVLSEDGNFFEQFSVPENQFSYLKGMLVSGSPVNGIAMVNISKRNNGGYNVSLQDFCIDNVTNKK